MTKPFKPMLASPADLDNLRFPVFASPKLDGIRCSIVGGKALSRTLKEIPSRHVFKALSKPEFEGLDGELIVGEPTSESCYRDTVSHVMADNKVFTFRYYVFDLWDHPQPFYMRRLDLKARYFDAGCDDGVLSRVQHVQIENREQLDAYEAEQVGLGHEGVMLADPNATYKFGRATTKGGELLKVKRFVDSEAVVIGIEEEMFNGNEAETNELGRTKRSTAKAGLVGKGTMGALIVRDVKTGVEFKIGTGFTAHDRANPPEIGSVRKYKFFPVGVKDKPRHPVDLGARPLGA
jgi:DNA ligase-1